MSYTPIDPALFTGPFAPSQGLDPVWGNHEEVPAAYQQDLGGYFGCFDTSDTTPQVFRFRCRANVGVRQVRVTYIWSRESGSGTHTITLASSTDSDAVSYSVDGPITASLTVDVPGPDAELTLTLQRTGGSNKSRLCAWRAFALPGDFDGFTGVSGTRWRQAGEPVNVEHVSRLLNGPIYVAQDGPHCLMSHFVPDLANLIAEKKKTGPDFRFWGLTGSPSDAGAMTQVGYGLIHVAGPRPRVLTVDSWIEVTDEAEPLLRIGGWTWEPGTSRDRTTVELPPGLHTVVASLAVPALESAIWASLQIWRR